MKIKYCLSVSLLVVTLNCFGQQQQDPQHWSIPDFGAIQIAGSIGDYSAGLGYDVFKSKARFSTHFGVVPLNNGSLLHVVSTKLFFRPASVTVWNRVHMNLVDVGLMASYSFGGDRDSWGPEGKVSKGYYWWNPALRAHLGMESSVTYEFRKNHRLRSVTGYVEFNTNEIYFIRFLKDIKTVSLWDIVKIGTGVRVYF